MDSDKKKEIGTKLADLKARWPKHSAPPWMWQKLEELEAELEKINKEASPKPDAEQISSGNL